MAKQGFEDLDVWKKARSLKIEINELVESFPIVEKQRLTDRLIRSSRSVSTLIAEGHTQHPFPNKIKYCIAARDFLHETLAHLVDAYDAKYISEELINAFRIKIAEIEKLLNVYISWFDDKPKKDKENGNTAVVSKANNQEN
ncbi:MAG: four helix bundle protein [Ferruginibacter sp.]